MKSLLLKLTGITAVFALLAFPLSNQAQADIGEDGPAFVQIVHNSADPAAEFVDVYLNGAVLFTDFEFRTATEFLELPSGVDHEVAIAPANSNTVGDALATFTLNLEAGTNYLAIATGVLDPDAFVENPDEVATAFELAIVANVANEADDDSEVILNIFHGSTDAPAVDITARAEPPVVLVPGAAYTAFASVPVAPASYIIDINVAGTSTTAASFDADLSAAGGAAVAVIASGFLNLPDNQFGAQFGLLAVFADGTTAMLPVRTGVAQVVHNSADPGAAMVDVYVNGGLLASDFEFRAATGFLELPARLTNYISIAPPNSESVEDAIATFAVNIPEGANWHLVANGVLNPDDFAANPNEISTAFDLYAIPMARTEAESGGVDFRVWHGATDAPAVDVRVSGGGPVLVPDLSYAEASEYANVPADDYVIDITAAGNGAAVVATYDLDVSSLEGGAALILASGFLSPEDNMNGAGFELLVVLPTGDAFLLPVSTSIDEDLATVPGSFELRANYPNPFNPTTNIAFTVPVASDVSLTVYDMLGRRVAELVNGSMSAGSHTVTFDAGSLASGVYLYRLQSGNFTETRKMMLVK